MQPNTHQPSGEADESAEQDDFEQEFDPGDSFTNDSTDQGGTGELPAWLQNFADTASEQPGGQPAQSAVSHQSTPPPPTPPVANETESFGAPSGADAGFFSDDDLPEWLRALSSEGDLNSGIEQHASAPAATTTANGTLQVPAVSRAWVTSHDQPDVSPGANLLASLVHVLDSRPDAVAPQPEAARSSAPSQPVVSKPQPKAAAASTSEESVASASWGRLRLVAIVAIVLILLLIIVMALGN